MRKDLEQEARKPSMQILSLVGKSERLFDSGPSRSFGSCLQVELSQAEQGLLQDQYVATPTTF